MDRNQILELMKEIYTAAEAAEYLNISTQRLHQLVQDGSLIPIKSNKSVTLFYKPDLDNRKISNFSNSKINDNNNHFDIKYLPSSALAICPPTQKYSLFLNDGCPPALCYLPHQNYLQSPNSQLLSNDPEYRSDIPKEPD